MQTRKDLYQAHKLMTQRLGLALLQGEPDLPESPMRRYNVATFAGILLVVLITAGFGIWGMLSPGGATKLKEAGQLLVEEETGASYIYNQGDGKLQPVANYVSARLLLDSQEIKVRTVSAESLAGFARGQKIGISGAPDSLPKPEKMVKSPWTVCVTEQTDATGVHQSYVTLLGGLDIGGTPVGGDALVVDDGQQNWVLWNNSRMRVQNVRRLTDQTPRKVPLSWVNAIPTGPDFVAPKIAQQGKRVAGPGGSSARVGQVFTLAPIAGEPERWYVLLADGLAPISQTQAMLLLQDPESKIAYGKGRVRRLAVDAAMVNAAEASAQPILGGGLPLTMPRFRTPETSAPLCAVYADTITGSVRAQLTTGAKLTIPKPPNSGGPDLVDQVLLPPGSAALAGHLPGAGQVAAINEYSLITDQGRRFRLASADVVGQLGYDAAQVTPLPAHLLRLIPEGPLLDPAAARLPVTEVSANRLTGG
ncbi:type VII secretion protein EccB [Nonomuraea zeae]|uniref:Type VII secretion protein EccB n=1 Tax=Nonomuraea zeae TaxID=1642303 RepID=A0A5S4GSQ9_9ACTN|nr:type VII secretion protein EccB [Nonomuraea zeae]TMR35988.1 type VII secretion protein EccB [Nonomuraea zeae]